MTSMTQNKNIILTQISGTRWDQDFNINDIDPDDCFTDIDEEEGTSSYRFSCLTCESTGLNYDDIMRRTGNCEDCEDCEDCDDCDDCDDCEDCDDKKEDTTKKEYSYPIEFKECHIVYYDNDHSMIVGKVGDVIPQKYVNCVFSEVGNFFFFTVINNKHLKKVIRILKVIEHERELPFNSYPFHSTKYFDLSASGRDTFVIRGDTRGVEEYLTQAFCKKEHVYLSYETVEMWVCPKRSVNQVLEIMESQFRSGSE